LENPQSSEKHYNSTNHIIRTAIKLIQCSVTNGSQYILRANSSGQTLTYTHTNVGLHVTAEM